MNAYFKIIIRSFRNLKEANTLVVELRLISIEDAVAVNSPGHEKSLFISQKPLSRLKSVDAQIGWSWQAVLWRNFGDVKASRRLSGGAAGFTRNSHLGAA